MYRKINVFRHPAEARVFSSPKCLGQVLDMPNLRQKQDCPMHKVATDSHPVLRWTSVYILLFHLYVFMAWTETVYHFYKYCAFVLKFFINFFSSGPHKLTYIAVELSRNCHCCLKKNMTLNCRPTHSSSEREMKAREYENVVSKPLHKDK